MPHRSDYRATPYHLDQANLSFYINEMDSIELTAKLHFTPREGRAGEVIELNGEDIDLKALVLQVGSSKPRELEIGTDYTIEVLTNLKGEPTDQSILKLLHPPTQPFTLTVYNFLDPVKNVSGHGLYQSDALLTTQCESAGFRSITYFIDRPDNLASYQVTINAPDTPQFKEILSNGNLVSYRKLEGGRHEAVWHDPFKKPSYLFALVTGDLRGLDQTFITHTGQPVQVRVLAEPEYADQLEYAQDLVIKSLKWQEEALGLTYDLDRYHCVGVKSFTQGAMENKSLNIFNASLMASSREYSTDPVYEYIEHVIPHELMHNYAGNRVTVRTWHELALKEGLASLLERLFVEHNSQSKVSRIDDVLSLIGPQFKEDAGNAKKAVRPESYDTSDELYTDTTYTKGAEIHYMLRHLLGKELWTHAIRQYFSERDGQAVTFEEYLDTMGRAAGKDLSQFTRWITQPGTPEVEIEGRYDERRKEYHLTIRQTNVEAPLLFPFQMGLLDPKGQEIVLQLKGQAQPLGTTACLEISQSEQTFVFTGVKHAPIPSLLRDYSAPIKITKTPVTEEQQLFLMHHDTDPVNKALASNHLMMEAMKNLMAQYKSGQALTVEPKLLIAMRDILINPVLSPDLKMCLVALPDEDQLTNELDEIDPDALHAIYRFMNLQIAGACSDVIEAIEAYYLHGKVVSNPEIRQGLAVFKGDPNGYSRHNAGIRSMLSWAISLDTVQTFNTPLIRVGALCSIKRRQTSADFNREFNRIFQQCEQLSQQGNATSYLAGLRKFLNLPIYEIEGLHPENVDLLLGNQLETLQGELAVCKGQQQKTENWLGLLGAFNSPITIQLIREIAFPQDPNAINKAVFDMANPNMAKRLIGSFARQNPHFHDLTGEGYALLVDYVIALSQINREAAGSVVRILTDDWQRMEPVRRQLMYRQLCRLHETVGLPDNVLSNVRDALEQATLDDKQKAQQSVGNKEQAVRYDMAQGLVSVTYQGFLQGLKSPERYVGSVAPGDTLSHCLTDDIEWPVPLVIRVRPFRPSLTNLMEEMETEPELESEEESMPRLRRWEEQPRYT